MTFDDLEPRPQRDAALAALAREDLELYSGEELHERIAALEAEITRIRTALDAKKAKISAADALFNLGS
ncbi:DUF1192 domain-containing protein [Brevundimonas sp.]|uniref:DUF1192 domain-containing protein n=1 Tax=Brevundimonas sp. TaxID=1871086 RepID=UPI002FD99267